jgi:hypothetical protein
MSRSTFALKFKQTVGASPPEYLTRWRMLLAGDKLANCSEPMSAIAISAVGQGCRNPGHAWQRLQFRHLLVTGEIVTVGAKVADSSSVVPAILSKGLSSLFGKSPRCSPQVPNVGAENRHASWVG